MRTYAADSAAYRARLAQALAALGPWLAELLGVPHVASLEQLGPSGGVVLVGLSARGDPGAGRSFVDARLRVTVDASIMRPAAQGEFAPWTQALSRADTLSADVLMAAGALAVGVCAPLEPLGARVVGDTVRAEILTIAGPSQDAPAARLTFEMTLLLRVAQPYPVE